MVKILLLTALINTDMQAVIVQPERIEARRRQTKGRDKRRRGGNGLR